MNPSNGGIRLVVAGEERGYFCWVVSVVRLSCCHRCMANLSDVDLFSPGVKSVKLDGVYQKV